MRRADFSYKPERPARRVRRGWLQPLLGAALAGFVGATALAAPERLVFSVATTDKDLERQVRQASLLLSEKADGQTEAQELFVAARADYARIIAALYAAGYYGPVIHIMIDGREAAGIAPLDAPTRIGTIQVSVDPGPRFRFSHTRIAPLAPGTDLPAGFAPGVPAEAGIIREAVDVSILAWRNVGHAKARVARDNVIANHPQRTLGVDIALDPGRKLRFGPITVRGAERMRPYRIVKISGLKTGEKFSEDELDRAATRLRRTGIFAAATLNEGAEVVGGDLLPIEILVSEQPRRHYSVGAEMATEDGLSLTGLWLHRNLLGGGERLEIDSYVHHIGSVGGRLDFGIHVSLDRPATITPDTTAGLDLSLGHLEEEDFSGNHASFGLKFVHYFSEELIARAGIAYEYINGSDPAGDFIHRDLALPLGVTWDRRDSQTDARKGFYIDATAKPFYGFVDTGSGMRQTIDIRGYKTFGEDDLMTLAARVQEGSILGTSLLQAPRDDLFLSGGGGTVRGQPYRSLGIWVPDGKGGTFLIGGTHMLVSSFELRTRVTEKIGIVGFADAGVIGKDGFLGAASEWHAGAGLGVRYETGLGPIRFDVAAPVHGSTGRGMQIYIGLGQAF